MADLSRSVSGAGQSATIAISEAAPAIPQPASRSGISEAGAVSETGRMNERSNGTVAAASTELTTPANTMQKAATAIAAVASNVDREASVPRQTRTAPAATERRLRSDAILQRTAESDQDQQRERPEACKESDDWIAEHQVAHGEDRGHTIAPRPARRRAA